ncbi:MAG TPA: ATP-binding protein [Nitrosomonas europaea]|uniref:ATP-binding protein n=1 Tax=Nitrosomonas europaea TaxID=915 RepID=UPI00249104BA|nr:ATP-binding protein [Nitrosomonas europaea]HRN82259.1 ATP-binding protein [Nitrosomonas europaea]HRO57105.1 ATP-binding protein [Nitrosomonas europaea]HUM74681.1 ATP-binding protein [Nitrosomonas europaea]
MMTLFQRPFVAQLAHRLDSMQPLIQVLTGPRQVGKTTGVWQLMAQCSYPQHYANADDVLVSDRSWLLEQWQQALLLGEGALLVVDEIQKVVNWPETIKALWDAQPGRLRVLLLGSSALQIQSGVTESLAGRFELLRVHHWTFAELHAAFGYDLPRYLAFGGYPGAVVLEYDPDRWYAYMKDAIVEAVIGKDILQSRKVANPALFRQAFEILCAYPAQEISYTKLLGQLQDKGNTDLVKYYIELYGGAFLLHALQKYSPKTWLARSSSPKMLPACPALYSMVAGVDVMRSTEQRGRAFELVVGAELMQLPGQVFYWRERNDEVDFVYQYRERLYAIEVKSGRKKSARGLDAFCAQEPKALRVIVTPENFAQFSAEPRDFLQQVAI